MTSIICPDCIRVMKVIDLLHYYCHKADLIVYIQHHVCLSCGNSSLLPIRVQTPEENVSIGRIETLYYTCDTGREHKEIPESVLFEIVKFYYKSLVIKVCEYIHSAQWVYKFEIALWDVINNIEEAEDALIYKDLKDIKQLAIKTNLWLVNTAHWLNLQNTDDNFVSIKKWKKMHKNQKTLLRYDNTGNPEENNKS
jgi:hypothetical protein